MTADKMPNWAEGPCVRCGKTYRSEVSGRVATDEDSGDCRVTDYADPRDAWSHLRCVAEGLEVCPSCWLAEIAADTEDRDRARAAARRLGYALTRADGRWYLDREGASPDHRGEGYTCLDDVMAALEERAAELEVQHDLYCCLRGWGCPEPYCHPDAETPEVLEVEGDVATELDFALRAINAYVEHAAALRRMVEAADAEAIRKWADEGPWKEIAIQAGAEDQEAEEYAAEVREALDDLAEAVEQA